MEGNMKNSGIQGKIRPKIHWGEKEKQVKLGITIHSWRKWRIPVTVGYRMRVTFTLRNENHIHKHGQLRTVLGASG
jgi:hypothetical protein